ncbi:MAG: TOBE domain-containing protein [Thermoplasmata archaeon]|nr:TOBE domain-containing protein [Thermoplasmata archaeon]
MSLHIPLLTPVDLDLLGTIDREASLVAACRRLGISRDTGVYRLRRLKEALGRPVVETVRGGVRHGVTRLTPAGRSLLDSAPGGRVKQDARNRPGFDANRWPGTWRSAPHPHVVVNPRLTFHVDFVAQEGEEVVVGVDPEAVLLARARFASSARNVFPGTVRRVLSSGPGTGRGRRLVEMRVEGTPFVAAVTDVSVRSLGLSRGARVVLYVKATAVKRRQRPRPIRGSPRS